MSIIPYSSAASATKGFIVDPGEYNPANDLFSKGLNLLFLISFQSLVLIPCVNLFGSNVGDDAMAITSPVYISITHIEPA